MVRLILILICTSVLGWCPNAADAAQTASGIPVSVRLPWKFQFESAPFIVAIEKGYYQEADLDVSLKEWMPGVNVIDEVTARKADFGMYASSLVVARANGKPVVAVAVFTQHSPIVILARRKAGINSVLDLAGKRLAFSHDTEDEILAYLSANGLTRKNFTALKREGFGIEMLTQDKADAISIYSTNEMFLTRGHEDEYVTFFPTSAAIDFFGDILYTAEAYLKEHPERVAAFRAATLKGLEYSLAHQNEVVDLIRAKYNTQGKSREQLLFEANRLAELTHPDIVEPGYMSLRRWQHVANIYAEQKKIPANFNLDGFYYDPRSKGLSPLVLWLLAGTVITLMIVSGVLIQVRRFNRRLQIEIDERRAAESNLRSANLTLTQAMNQLAQSEKLASLGALVAGVAHEVNTPVGITLTTASTFQKATRELERLMSEGLLRKSELLSYIETANQSSNLIVRNAERAAHLVQNFKQIAADQTSEIRREYVLKDYIDEVISSLGPKLKRESIQIASMCQDAIVVDGYPGAMAQILTNLTINALTHAFAEQESGHIMITAELVAENVHMTFKDDGVGIAPENIGKLFSPFFTTRRGSGGTGLGLNIVHNILHKQFGGTISVVSEPGCGTCFSMRFPCVSPRLHVAPEQYPSRTFECDKQEIK